MKERKERRKILRSIQKGRIKKLVGRKKAAEYLNIMDNRMKTQLKNLYAMGQNPFAQTVSAGAPTSGNTQKQQIAHQGKVKA